MIAGIPTRISDERRLTIACWAITGLTGVVVAASAFRLGLTVEWSSAFRAGITCLALGSLVWFYRSRRSDERIAVSLSCVVQLIAFTSFAAPLSYVAASTAYPQWDETLYAWDRALGLDWLAYLAFVNDRPWLGTCFKLAYLSLVPQTVIAAVALGLSGRLLECRAFIAAVMISGLISIAFSMAMPAVAMFVHLGLHPDHYPNLMPAAAFVHMPHLSALRDGTMHMISLTGTEGIITFPSYHTALGVIFIHALWAVPSLRWPGLAINVLMIAATPIDGGHYFVDVLAGIVVAVLSIAAVRLVRLQKVSDVPWINSALPAMRGLTRLPLPPQGDMTGAAAKKPGGLLLALDLIERAVIAVLFAAMAWSFLRGWTESGGLVNLILLVSEGSVIAFVLVRRFTASMSMRPADWLIAFLGTMAPLLVRPTGGEPWASAVICMPLMLTGMALQLSAKLTLRRSFGIVAANRGVKVGGPYRVVRHPMYAGYVLTQVAFLLTNLSLWNMAVYGLAFALQIRRILAEEDILGQDPAYRAFTAAVPYRLAPRIF